jgi:hypothetical protein
MVNGNLKRKKPDLIRDLNGKEENEYGILWSSRVPSHHFINPKDLHSSRMLVSQSKIP